jgi:proteasome lid subunit RPN8/RPN11
MRLEISRDVLAGIRAEVAGAHPLEACGLLFGGAGGIDGWQVAYNIAEYPEREFEIDPTVLFAALRAERAGGPRLIGYWHSHPNGKAEPSALDREAAQNDGKVWLIFAGDDVTAWRVKENEILDLSTPDVVLHDGEPLAVQRYYSSGRTIKSFEHIPLMTGEIRNLIPRDKCDEDIVPMIAAAGYPAIAPILDDLMEWTADPNWPICVPLIDYLVTLGEPMVEPIRRLLRGTDDDHKWVCLRGMLAELPPAIQALLREDLQRLAELPSDGGGWGSLDDEARKILSALPK